MAKPGAGSGSNSGACAELIGAGTQEIAFVKNTSEGLSTAAFGLTWRKGDRVVVPGAEFASNLYPWLEVGNRYGVDVVVVPETTGADAVRRVSVDRLMEEMSHPQTRVVTLSHVEYASGQRFDVRSIGRYCRRRGILFCVDAIQSLGVFPINVHEMCIDVVATEVTSGCLPRPAPGFSTSGAKFRVKSGRSRLAGAMYETGRLIPSTPPLWLAELRATRRVV